jgi:two-component system NtrC family response regulator
METILIVDDKQNYTAILSNILEEDGFETLSANNANKALDILSKSDVDLVLTDMKMPYTDGIALLDEIKDKDPDLPVIIMTAYGTIEKAVEAMQKGAYNYILKPFDNKKLSLYVSKAISMYRIIKENRRLRDTIKEHYSFNNIIGKSVVMKEVFEMMRKIIPTSSTVLIEGASGTGKELVAKSLHFNGPRNAKPWVAINCSALAVNLLESELFGHEKGAFTGAIAMKKGRFELADRGTLFLDEVGELSTELQVKLLRVLQEKSFERVGGIKPISVDIRIIAATNKSLQDEVLKGNFREDLFYRLNVLRIDMPPLRARTEDINLLINHFINKYDIKRSGKYPVLGVNYEVRKLFLKYKWPGNIRELENVLEHAVLMCSNEIISIKDLPRNFRKDINKNLQLNEILLKSNLYETLAYVEKNIIIQALKKANYVQARAAEILDIGKSGLNQKIKKHKIITKK